MIGSEAKCKYTKYFTLTLPLHSRKSLYHFTQRATGRIPPLHPRMILEVGVVSPRGMLLEQGKEL